MKVFAAVLCGLVGVGVAGYFFLNNFNEPKVAEKVDPSDPEEDEKISQIIRKQYQDYGDEALQGILEVIDPKSDHMSHLIIKTITEMLAERKEAAGE